MTGSGLAKIFSGFLIAVALVAGLGFIASQVLIGQYTAPPPKPVFPNDNPKPQPSPKAAASRAAAKPMVAAQPASPASSPSPSVSPSPQASPTGYKVRIVLNDGLNMREQPNAGASRVGGVDYDQQVTVLEESPDKEWQKIRVEPDGPEGWIKSGYTERVN